MVLSQGVRFLRVSHFAWTATILASVLFFSCSARYDVVVGKDGSAKADFSASVGVRTATLITNLAGSAASSKILILDALAVSKALKASSAVSSISLLNPDSRSLSGSVGVSRFDRFLSPRFIRVRNVDSGGFVTFTIDRAIAPEILASLSPEIEDYLSALMAPIVTGEKLGGEEYLSLVSAVYGEGVAREIREAKVVISLKLPGPAVSVEGGSAVGGAAEYRLPLIDFLTLEKPIRMEASW